MSQKRTGGGRGHRQMLSNFLRSRRKQKLIEELEANPEPSAETFIELIHLYHEDGDFQAATRTAKRGAELYPESEKMLQSRAEMERVTRDLEKERLRQKIESYPNPILYARLAELYKMDGEVTAARRVCQLGISRFDSYGGTYLVLGEICYENGDFAGARIHLEKAAELDKYNYTALRLLSLVYMELGEPAKAARRLEEMLYFAPGDESILELLRQAREAAGEPPLDEEATAEIVEEQDEEPVATMEVGEGVDDAGRGAVEEMVEPAIGEAGPEAVRETAPSKTQPREHEINEAISTIAGVGGVSGALLVDAYGLVIAADLNNEVDEELAGAMMTNIFRTVSRSAEPMGIGSFEDTLIEGEGGNIHVLGVEDMILAVFASANVKMGMLEKTIRDFVDRIID
ncbi:MAG: roadblock/LC7 domain-containing protein [Planctomycetota bacterium]